MNVQMGRAGLVVGLLGLGMGLVGAGACQKSEPLAQGSLGTITVGAPVVADPAFDESWKKLGVSGADVFYIEDDRGEGLMGKVRRAAEIPGPVPPPSPSPAPSPALAPGEAEVPSGDQVSSVIRTNLSNVKMCYLRMTRSGRMVNGKAIVSFGVDKDGVVQGVKVDAPSFRETDLPGCVSQQVARWAFPKSKKGIVAVSYPFVFVGG